MDGAALKRLFAQKLFIIELCTVGGFLLLSLITPFGILFGLVRSPILYTLLTLVPAVAFLICYLAMTFPKKKNTEQAEKKNRK